jgi:predicted transcriptional regulator
MKVIFVKAEDELHRRAAEIAKTNDRTLSQFVRDLLRDAISRANDQSEPAASVKRSKQTVNA